MAVAIKACSLDRLLQQRAVLLEPFLNGRTETDIGDDLPVWKWHVGHRRSVLIFKPFPD